MVRGRWIRMLRASAWSARLRARKSRAGGPIGTSACRAASLRKLSDNIERSGSRNRVYQRERIRACRADEAPGVDGTESRAETAAKSDDREQPFALIGGERIIGERPELGDHHDVEDADPEEVHDAHMKAELTGDEEQRAPPL